MVLLETLFPTVRYDGDGRTLVSCCPVNQHIPSSDPIYWERFDQVTQSSDIDLLRCLYIVNLGVEALFDHASL